jgi:beta-lactamase regulating signal transducer with metallopeptidase domain
MAFELRLLVVSLAAFAWAGIAGAAVAGWLWRRPFAASPADRAGRLFCIRLIPIGLAVLSATLAIVSFVLFEPRGLHETTGWILAGLAALGAALIVSTAIRSAGVARASRRTWRAWMETAEPILVDEIDVPAFAVNTPFPVVAVVGFWRPRLVIARSVLSACTPGEVRAILRHERHHLDRRDNLRRAVLALAPDVLGVLPASARLLRAWHEATEEAADDFARRTDEKAGVVLAQALLKVARLAPSGSLPTVLPASALYRGESLERRVRRLLAPAPDGSRSGHRLLWAGAAGAGIVMGCALALEQIHQVVETAVNLLP